MPSPKPSKVSSLEWMALNHLITPAYGMVLGASVAPKGEKLEGVKEGFKQSLGPALRNDALILATHLLGGRVKGESFSKRFLKRLGALTALSTGAALTQKNLPRFSSKKLDLAIKQRIQDKKNERN